MKYDFKTVVNRRHTDSVKWNVQDNELPMSIADMDFKTAPEIILAMQEKLKLGPLAMKKRERTILML